MELAVQVRSCRALPHPAASPTDQGDAGRVAGTQGSGLQRGEDANRPPIGGVRFPGIQRPPL
jgi:hypothetical protein